MVVERMDRPMRIKVTDQATLIDCFLSDVFGTNYFANGGLQLFMLDAVAR